jgi:N-acyl-D-amino-acid deacylase
LPATNQKIRDRGELKQGHYADIVIFDPSKIQDHATFQDPHQYSTGMQYGLVNGIFVLIDGEHPGALPEKVVRGPSWKGWSD